VVRADLRDEGSVRAALAGAWPDAVCHLAGLGKVRESFQHPEEYHAVNAGGTRTLLDALTATAPGRRFVFASSVAVYGVPEHQPVAEDAPLLPTSPTASQRLRRDKPAASR
jgi:UDP-glucose 4-epimerase